jgi:hypothetical protein
VGNKAAGYVKRMTFGFSALYPELAAVFWSNIAGWIKAGWVRPLRLLLLRAWVLLRLIGYWMDIVPGRVRRLW